MVKHSDRDCFFRTNEFCKMNQMKAHEKFSLLRKFQLLLFLLDPNVYASPCTYSVGKRKVEKASDTENTIVSEKIVITDQE